MIRYLSASIQPGTHPETFKKFYLVLEPTSPHPSHATDRDPYLLQSYRVMPKKRLTHEAPMAGRNLRVSQNSFPWPVFSLSNKACPKLGETQNGCCERKSRETRYLSRKLHWHFRATGREVTDPTTTRKKGHQTCPSAKLLY